MSQILIYGSYGYTGELIVQQAVQKGLKPLIGGRNEDLLKAQASKHGLDYVCFNYDDQSAWDQALNQVDLLVNCAGPFSFTIREILPACLRNKVHYTDITGEIEVFQYVHQHHQQAVEENITLMPGVGFDVVPTDCLAKFLKDQLPSAQHLELAFDSASGLSRGTALSLLNRLSKGSSKRVDGEVVSYPTGTLHKLIHFAGEDRFSVGVAWGDVFTAYHTTGIPNITVFTTMTPGTMKWLSRMGKWSGLMKSKPIQALGRTIIRRSISGPSDEKRISLKTHLWGRVWDNQGNEKTAELTCPESYGLTARTALECAENMLKGKAKSGFQTPAAAFGADFILAFDSETFVNV
ncbi:MAG: saccharopine dehydrogenase NADP-binding domain-containing protein [Bacteroidetes bacterium]|nr:saccharopine dehydrogenase NADP-binding domain-containing protein [Bacteroidota bacterium]